MLPWAKRCEGKLSRDEPRRLFAGALVASRHPAVDHRKLLADGFTGMEDRLAKEEMEASGDIVKNTRGMTKKSRTKENSNRKGVI